MILLIWNKLNPFIIFDIHVMNNNFTDRKIVFFSFRKNCIRQLMLNINMKWHAKNHSLIVLWKSVTLIAYRLSKTFLNDNSLDLDHLNRYLQQAMIVYLIYYVVVYIILNKCFGNSVINSSTLDPCNPQFGTWPLKLLA